MNSHLRDFIKILLGATTLVVMLTACSPTTVPTAEVVVRPPQPTPTLEPTFTPSPSPTDTPTLSPTATTEPTPTPLPEASLSGRILDQETGQPIAEAKVSAGTSTATTDADGRYSLTGLPPGQYVLSTTHEGYDPALSAIFTLTTGQELEVDLALYAPNTSPYPQDPMLTNPLDPNGAPTQEDAEQLARLQGLTSEIVSIEETKLRGEFLVNYKIGDDIRAAVAELNHEAWELTDETGRQWWIIKVCGNLASPLPKQITIATPAPHPLPPLAEVIVDRASVRACAAEECAELGMVERGTQIEIFGCLADGGWCEVGWSGERGWCTGRSLRQLAVAEVVPVMEAVLPTPTPGVVVTGLGKIAFESYGDPNSDIYTINVDGSELTRLTDHPAEDWDPAWSPDRQGIAFVSKRDSKSFDIYVMNADSGAQTRLTDQPGEEWDPAWSPDGTHIAFTLGQINSSKSEIYVVNADGGGLTRLADGGDPSWSPDGTRIVFASSDVKIYVMNADASGQMHLADGLFPTWSPDGRKIVFSSFRDGNEEIYVMNADGGGQTRLTNHPGSDRQPTWSPDGQQIAFASSRDGAFDIYIMNVDGSGLTHLTRGYGPAWSP